VAHYHCSIKTGAKGAAADHAAYIAREGRFADQERYGAVVAQGVGHMPSWAREEPAAFWRAADAFERENGNTYREFELALPRELSRSHQIALVERFIESELGGQHAYQWALHADQARDGGEQPHVHVMFSDRIQDGIERGPEQYFKRANRKSPEKGGCLKKSYGATQVEAAEAYRAIRARWGAVQNLALEHQGVEARVDHRSLAGQGIHTREPGVHQGPAVAGIEARGEVSEVGRRQREQIAAREAKREAVLAEGLSLERKEKVAERVAARERRELAPFAAEASKEDRAELERHVEADRRAQLERATHAAARRLERREAALERAKPTQLSLFTRLVEQGRALKQRLSHAFERVKEWVQDRFQRSGLSREEIQAGKAEFRAGFERHKAEQAERRQVLEAGRERYQEQKAAELERQREAQEREKSRSSEGTLEKHKDRDHGLEL
jgi:MobA/MobL family